MVSFDAFISSCPLVKFNFRYSNQQTEGLEIPSFFVFFSRMKKISLVRKKNNLVTGFVNEYSAFFPESGHFQGKRRGFPLKIALSKIQEEKNSHYG